MIFVQNEAYFQVCMIYIFYNGANDGFNVFGLRDGLVVGLCEFTVRTTTVGSTDGSTEGSTLFEEGLEVGCEVVEEFKVGGSVNLEIIGVGKDVGWDVEFKGW